MSRNACLITVFLVVMPHTLSGDNLEVEKLLQVLEGAIESIHSYDLRIGVTTRAFFKRTIASQETIGPDGSLKPPVFSIRKLQPGENPTVHRESFRQVYDQGHGRLEYLDLATGQPFRIVVNDPEVERIHHLDRREAVIRRPDTSLVIEGGDYREAYRAVYGRLGIIEILRQRLNNLVIRSNSNESPLVIIDAGPLPKPWTDDKSFHSTGFRVSLDPRRGMLPAVVERFRDIEGKPFTERRLTVNEWKEVAKGVWVPIKSTSHIFSNDKQLQGEVANEIVLIVDVASSSWNKPVPKQNFELTLPVGTTVVDMERRVKYVTGKSDPGKNLEELTANARNVMPFGSKPSPSESSWPAWLTFGLSTSAALVLGLVGVWLYRRRSGRVA